MEARWAVGRSAAMTLFGSALLAFCVGRVANEFTGGHPVRIEFVP